jgi:hypothetical protein
VLSSSVEHDSCHAGGVVILNTSLYSTPLHDYCPVGRHWTALVPRCQRSPLSVRSLQTYVARRAHLSFRYTCTWSKGRYHTVRIGAPTLPQTHKSKRRSTLGGRSSLEPSRCCQQEDTITFVNTPYNQWGFTSRGTPAAVSGAVSWLLEGFASAPAARALESEHQSRCV